MKLLVLTCAVTALLLAVGPVHAEEKQDAMVEQTTESPIADMALVDTKADAMKADTAKTDSDMTADKEAAQKLPADTQPQTIADFIIHPLIALKPRVPEVENGKQADGGTTTPSPWQLFGFNAGQGLGSSVSSLAGSVTGWLGNRIQLPGLVDTPVRETTTTTTSTTTTTTPRPDVVVRVKQRGSTRKPLISINNDNNNDRPKRPRKKPNHFDNHIDDSEEEDDSEEFEDDEDFNRKRKRYQNHDDEDDDEGSNENDEDVDEDDDEEEDDNDDEHHEDDDEEEEEERPVKKQTTRRRRPKPLNHDGRRRNSNRNHNGQRRRVNNNQRKRYPKPQQHEDSAEEDQYEDDNDDQDFYYSKNQGSKRSQSEQNFIQRGQQSLLKQIRQLTRGQTPAEVGNALRKSAKNTKKTRGQQATLIINRNGQTVYVAPELLQVSDEANNEITATHKKRPVSNYPQPPLTVPFRRKGQPTQYITIPWSQLGISPPDEIVSLTEGLQSKPLILNIPQSAINTMQSLAPNKKRPTITADAVPLLAEASIMDIFKPPRIPPARTPSTTTTTAKPTKKVTVTGTPVVIATKTKAGPTRIRPATLVEKAPADEDMKDEKATEDTMEDDDDNEATHFIVIGDGSDDKELSRSAYQQILEYFNQRRIGRELNVDEMIPMESDKTEEQLIPVQIVNETEEEAAKVETPKAEDKMEVVEESKDADKMMEETPKQEEVKEEKAEVMMEEVPKQEEAKEEKAEAMMEPATSA